MGIPKEKIVDVKTELQILLAEDIRPTANRLIVLKTLLQAGEAMSLRDLDTRILTMDRSSIFRVLQVLSEHRLLHEIDDGSGSMKYEYCSDHELESGHHHDDEHVHFYCERCQHTFCLQQTPIPQVSLPEGYSARFTNFVIHGICADCAGKRQ